MKFSFRRKACLQALPFLLYWQALTRNYPISKSFSRTAPEQLCSSSGSENHLLHLPGELF